MKRSHFYSSCLSRSLKLQKKQDEQIFWVNTCTWALIQLCTLSPVLCSSLPLVPLVSYSSVGGSNNRYVCSRECSTFLSFSVSFISQLSPWAAFRLLQQTVRHYWLTQLHQPSSLVYELLLFPGESVQDFSLHCSCATSSEFWEREKTLKQCY